MPPNPTRRALSLGSARAASISLLSFSTISVGVPLRRAETEPCACLVARQEFSNRRDVRQELKSALRW